MKRLLVLIITCLLLTPWQSFAEKKSSYRFVIITKVVHPWFDLVYEGAKNAAAMIEEQTGAKVTIEYHSPPKANVMMQNRLFEQAIASRPDGITIDLLDEQANRVVIEEALRRDIPVVIFDSVPPKGMGLTGVGNDFCEQAKIASRRLAEMLNGKGNVAIMLGFPTAVNHKIRARCHEEVFNEYPDITVVAKGTDNDSIETARKQAKAIMQAYPQLDGWVSCNAAGPIGIGRAIKEAGKVGKILSVGTDDLPEMIALIKEGVVDSSAATKPRAQGYWTILALWQANLGAIMPKRIDTGINVITKEMAENYQEF